MCLMYTANNKWHLICILLKNYAIISPSIRVFLNHRGFFLGGGVAKSEGSVFLGYFFQ